jgi:hypothetical protein
LRLFAGIEDDEREEDQDGMGGFESIEDHKQQV